MEEAGEGAFSPPLPNPGPEGGATDDIVAKFEQFFRIAYEKELSDFSMNHPNATSIVVDFKRLESFDYELADALLDNPDVYLDAMEEALSRIEIPGVEPGTRLKVRLTNIPEDRILLVRDIRSEYIGKIIGAEGLVRQITTVMPKLKVARWACRHCGRTYDILQDGNKLKKPFVCVCGKKDFELIPDQSVWVDFQKIQIQEPIEYLRGGEQARFIDVYLEGDLVNTVKPGDRVNVVGILKLLQPDGRRTVYGKYIQALHIERKQKEFEELEPTPEEIKKIKELAKDPNIYEKLVRSIAPTIWGHENIKEAVALQLFGGVPKELPDHSRIRGNIHILLMGDPGTGKSQILRHVAQIAPKSIYVAGKTASGAGLTASAEKDEMGEGGWVIKAGALVLASGGIAAVDEFEKIDAKDRAALHEAMEQQSYHHDFEIMLADGKKVKIGELVDNIIEQNRDRVVYAKDTEILPNPGIELLAYDMKEKKILPVRADRVSRHTAPKHYVEIEFSNGRRIRVTPEHPVMVWREGTVKEVPAEEIRAGDLAIGVNHYKTEATNHIGEAMARFLGFLASEGFTYSSEKNRYYEVGICNTNEEIIEEIRHVLEEIGQKYSVSVSSRGRKKTLYTIRIISKDFYNRIAEEFPEVLGKGDGRPSHNKRVPARIMAANDPEKRAFLNAYFKGDGFISPLRTGYITSSRKMAEDIQDLLLSLGIYSYIAEENRGNRKYYKVVVSGRNSLEKFLDIVKDDRRVKRIESLIRMAERRANHRDPLPTDIVREIKYLLKTLHIDDGALGNNLKRGQNIHRETAEKYLERIEERLGKLLDAIEREDVKEIAKILTNRWIAKKLKIHESTLRYKRDRDAEVREKILTIAKGVADEVRAKIEKMRRYVDGNIRFLRVKRITHVANRGEKWVYDVTVEPHHLFVTGGLVLHNTISVAKAGIVTTFKADTAILAAANPKFGRFDPYENPIQQINIEPTILSRFDLMFIVREVLEAERDRQIARHILKTHLAGEKRMAYTRGTDTSLTAEEVEEAEKHVKPEIDIELLRKYIAYARSHVFPTLTEEAMKKIEDFYVNLRQLGKKSGTVPTTARQLEALIRLAEASARVRLSDKVTVEDAERAIRLAQSSMEEVLKDKETGVFDYDILTTGESKSKREKMKIILNIIRSYTQEHDSIPLEDLVEEAKSFGIDDQEVYDLVEKLKKNGEIYEPRPGILRPAG